MSKEECVEFAERVGWGSLNAQQKQQVINTVTGGEAQVEAGGFRLFEFHGGATTTFVWGAVFGFAAGCAAYWVASRFFCPCGPDGSCCGPRSDTSSPAPSGSTPLELLLAESRHREEIDGHKITLDKQARELAARQCTISVLQEQLDQQSRPRRGRQGRAASRGHGAGGSESEGYRSEPAPRPGRSSRTFYSRSGLRRETDIAE